MSEEAFVVKRGLRQKGLVFFVRLGGGEVLEGALNAPGGYFARVGGAVKAGPEGRPQG